MPAVPDLPGVPQLSSYLNQAIDLLTSDVLGFFVQSLYGTQWGIYRGILPVLVYDSVVSFDFRQDFPISDYPVEGGGFQSYNKVQLPGDIRVQVACGGSESRRQAFLYSINAVIASTDLFNIVTPEQVYVDYCFSHRDFRRRANNGLGLIVVDLWFTEIKETSTATFSTTQQPGDAGAQALGHVQPEAPPVNRITVGPVANIDPNRSQIIP